MFKNPFGRLDKFTRDSGIPLKGSPYVPRWFGRKPLSAILSNLKRKHGEDWKAHLKRLGSEFGDITASNFLNYSFGWKPFIQDILDIFKALSQFSQRLQQLKDEEGKVLIRRYRRVLDVSLPSSTASVQWDQTCRPSNIAWTPTMPGYLGEISRVSTWVQRPVYVFTRQYSYRLPDISNTMLSIRAFQAALGFKLSPDVIWNAIPFSFVLDWLFDVNAFMARISHDGLGIDLTVLDECESISHHVQRRTYYRSVSDGFTFYEGNAFYSKPIPKRLIATEERRYYQRIAGHGLSRGQFGARAPRVRHILLGSALTYALSRNRKPRVAASFNETGSNS